MHKYILGLAIFITGIYVAYVVVVDEPQPISDVPSVSYEDVQNVESVEDVDSDQHVEEVNDSTKPEAGSTPTTDAPESETGIEEGEPLPAQFNLAVPFTPQAPHANWALPYGETCEEASAYMVSEYYKGTPSGLIQPAIADQAILDIVDFQEDFLGYYLDTTASETVSFMDAYYGVFATVITDPTVTMIKAEIAAGRPVILPAAGRELGNPNFTGEGPLYHMLVIKGYTEDQFITNDPGTRNGENYLYDIDVLMAAMGDWNNGDPANGAKVVIFTQP